MKTSTLVPPIQEAQETTAPDGAQIFTLLFKGGAVAALRIYGSESREEARALAASLLPGCAYEVKDGDPQGDVAVFYSWTSASAREWYPHPERKEARA